MSDPLSDIWRTQQGDAQFPQAEELTMKLTKLERRVRIRNAVEYAAGGLALVLFGGSLIAAITAGEFAFALAFAAVMVGVLVVLWNLRSRASALPSAPETDCRTHLRAQLVRQRDALRSVPLWYIGPLVPGVLGVYLATAWRVSEAAPWSAIVRELALPLGGTLLFFAFVCWLNLHSARKLSEQIARVDAA